MTRVLAVLFWLLLVGTVYFDPLFQRRNFAGRDLLGYHLPVEKSVHDAYARGRWPVWVSEISGGRPLLANLNVGALYPIRPLLSRTRFPLAMRIYPVLHWALTGCGVLWLARSALFSWPAAWVSAVTYVFCGVGVSQVFYTNTHAGVMLLPWIVWSVARAVAGSPGRILLASTLFALDFLAGDPFTAGLAVLACVLWILREERGRSRITELRRLAVAVTLAALLALPQLVATLLWIPETNRAVSGMRLTESLRFSVTPLRLLEFLFPYPFGPTWAEDPRGTWAAPAFAGLAMGFFPTLYAGSFAVCAAIIVWKSTVRGARMARALLWVGLGSCVLPSLVPSSWKNWRAPIPLRYPEKMAVALALGAALLAGLGFDALRQAAKRRRWPIVVGATFSLCALATALAPRFCGRAAVLLIGADASRAPVAGAHLPGALAEGGLLWMTAAIAIELVRRGRPWAVTTALCLITICPVFADRRIARSYREEEIFAPTPFARAIDRRDPERSFRALGESRYIPSSGFESAQMSADVGFLEYRRRSWLFYTPALWGRGVVFNDDFDAGDLSRVESLRRLSFDAGRYADPAEFFGSASLRFGIRFPDQPPVAGFRRFGGTGTEAWDENPRALRDLRLLERWREEPDAVAALKDLPALQPGEVTLETGLAAVASARRGDLRILEKTPERLRVETRTSDPTFLFVLRGFWSHRSVRLDGRPAVVVPAQLAFSAVAIPAGSHRVDWLEEFPGWRFSRWGPVAAVVAGFALAGVSRRRRAAPGAAA